jgi:hypothetical protein
VLALAIHPNQITKSYRGYPQGSLASEIVRHVKELFLRRIRCKTQLEVNQILRINDDNAMPWNGHLVEFRVYSDRFLVQSCLCSILMLVCSSCITVIMIATSSSPRDSVEPVK